MSGTALEWEEISRVTVAAPIPPAPNGSNPRAGQLEYWTTVIRRAVWPQDGSLYAGISYDRECLYLSPVQGGHLGQLISSSEYPTAPGA